MAADVLTALRAQVRLAGLRAMVHEGRAAEVIDEHAAIVASLRAGDVEMSLASVRRHLLATQRAMTSAVRDQERTRADGH